MISNQISQTRTHIWGILSSCLWRETGSCHSCQDYHWRWGRGWCGRSFINHSCLCCLWENRVWEDLLKRKKAALFRLRGHARQPCSVRGLKRSQRFQTTTMMTRMGERMRMVTKLLGAPKWPKIWIVVFPFNHWFLCVRHQTTFCHPFVVGECPV